MSFRMLCMWKVCPDEKRKYSVDEMNTRKANDYGYCTIIGNTPLPHNKVTSWNTKILKPRNNNGSNIFIGVALSNINQNEDYNYEKCGWYLYCFDSALFSGPPHKYKYKEYGTRKRNGKYVHTGDSVGVVVDTTEGEISFVVNGVNIGVAFDEILLDEPLVFCVVLVCPDDSMELII